MILLDTNVLSEAMQGRGRGDAAVLAWLEQLRSRPATTVINRAEIMSGIAVLPRGRRREGMLADATRVFDNVGVCLPLTSRAADRYGDVVAARRRVGEPIGRMDALMAAIALTEEATIATRDIRDFAGVGLDLVNPWDAR